MMSDVDYVIAPSEFVADSFRKRGFPPERILYVPYVTDLENFRPLERRPADRPLTLVNTGSLSLRKGTPYLLEAYAQVRKVVPEARLLLTRQISGSIPSVLRKYRGLPIDWAETLDPRQLCQRLQSADVFILPSLEDGYARTVAEALACGLPVIVTPNTGASDLVEEGSTGSIVPICDAGAIAAKILEWWEKIRKGRTPSVSLGLDDKLSWARFEKNFSGAIAGVIR